MLESYRHTQFKPYYRGRAARRSTQDIEDTLDMKAQEAEQLATSQETFAWAVIRAAFYKGPVTT